MWRRPLSLWPVVYVSNLALGAKASGIYRVGRIEWEKDGHSAELTRECVVECDGEDEIADALKTSCLGATGLGIGVPKTRASNEGLGLG